MVRATLAEITGKYREHPVWDELWRGRLNERICVGVQPCRERVGRVRERYQIVLEEQGFRPGKWRDEWRQWLLDDLYSLLAAMQLPGEMFHALSVPRALHGQSQGMVDVFGVAVEPQEDGNVYARPLPAQPRLIDDLGPGDVQASQYYQAVEWVRYTRAATGNLLPMRMPVMTGPLDTAVYVLGASTLLEWLYTQETTVAGLLDRITQVNIAMIRLLQEAAGGAIHSHHYSCMRGGFDLCSETRSVISAEHFAAFEAPRLWRIGQSCGSYGIHSCGNWARTVEASCADPNLRAMHGQVRENDLAELCALARGRVTLSIGPSMNLPDRYTWPDRELFLRYILAHWQKGQPLEIVIQEQEIDLWRSLHRQVLGEEADLSPPAWPNWF
jgi:hypothetical protein